jgi:hypothetical protein
MRITLSETLPTWEVFCPYCGGPSAKGVAASTEDAARKVFFEDHKERRDSSCHVNQLGLCVSEIR